MPYKLSNKDCPDDKPFGVINSDTGESVGCHETEEQAKDHMAALYANVEDVKKESAFEETIESAYEQSPNVFAYSFAELEQYAEIQDTYDNVDKLTTTFSDLMHNIIAFVPDYGIYISDTETKPKDEMIMDLVGEYTERMKTLFSLRMKADTTVKDFIHSVYQHTKSPIAKLKELVGKKKQQSNFMLWKEAGVYRWLAIYSNNFRDRDEPSNIIAAKSHKRFIELVESGQAEYPVLQHWHTKGTEWGIADWLAYDEDSGFALASGYVLPGHEAEAEKLSLKKNIGVSHGMPTDSLKFEDSKNGVIIEHITVEISDLPDWAAANQLTGFAILNKEDNSMTIPEVKKQYLQSVGVSDVVLQSLDKTLKETSEGAKAAGIEFKETSTEEVVESDVVTETVADVDATEAVVETSEEVVTDEVVETVAEVEKVDNVEETVVKAVAAILQPFIQKLDSVAEKQDAIIKELDEGKKEVVKEIDLTPSASWTERILKSLSPTQSALTQVDESDSLLAKKPVETEDKELAQPIMVRGNPVLGTVLSNMLTKKS